MQMEEEWYQCAECCGFSLEPTFTCTLCSRKVCDQTYGAPCAVSLNRQERTAVCADCSTLGTCQTCHKYVSLWYLDLPIPHDHSEAIEPWFCHQHRDASSATSKKAAEQKIERAW